MNHEVFAYAYSSDRVSLHLCPSDPLRRHRTLPCPSCRRPGTKGGRSGGVERRGIEAVVYCNGESTVNAKKRSYYPRAEWPLSTETSGMLKELDHVSWSIEEAAKTCDLIHINSAPAITYSRYVSTPFVCTLHHPHETALTRMYERYPEIHYVAISEHQASVHPTLAVTTKIGRA